jgi:hypothetical protein
MKSKILDYIIIGIEFAMNLLNELYWRVEEMQYKIYRND